ncbi:MAG: hypothetical protein Q7T81_09320 [Pseudolabrys sp.]|nr:hypothetical protein [Pseudolabrys sp.]
MQRHSPSHHTSEPEEDSAEPADEATEPHSTAPPGMGQVIDLKV